LYEDLKEEDIVNKVGGRFKLSTLLQKRVVQLAKGSRPLVATSATDRMLIALQEIREDKIFLDPENEVAFRSPEPQMEAPELDLDDL
jgi:DNA-directed RNA polymerase subunit omega